ncbi:MAG TPA: helix-turn-helix domain-containing protein [Gemmataceae bacterium]|nr:helix-turn-helix domain-containing protein [Gemmataceae bacterium]
MPHPLNASAPAAEAGPAVQTARASADTSNRRQRRPRPSAAPDHSAVITKRQLANQLQTSERSLERMMAKNLIPGVLKLPGGRGVRFNRKAIESWIAEGCPQPSRRAGR